MRSRAVQSLSSFPPAGLPVEGSSDSRRILREFRSLIDGGARILAAGEASQDPGCLLKRGYLPRYKVEIFGTRVYLAAVRHNPAIRFFVAYVVPPARSVTATRIYPRIFYKDLSLIWRVVSHMVANDREFWIGKGAVERVVKDGYEHLSSMEWTTDLPYEMQGALEGFNGGQKHVLEDEEALFLVLRNGPHGRIEPYRDFTAPREAARAEPSRRINGGRRVARFRRKNDPDSLVFAPGYKPDLRRGVIDVGRSWSRLYGGEVRRFTILSENRRIQYLFLAAPELVWIIPPQAMTTELSTYCVRTIDVHADEHLFVPGFEYHYMDHEQDPPQLISQIPDGHAGTPSESDPSRADAASWLEKLPIVREFRCRLL